MCYKPLLIEFIFKQELELRIETQKQTLQARDESIKKLLEMLQNKGMGMSLFSFLHKIRIKSKEGVQLEITFR